MIYRPVLRNWPLTAAAISHPVGWLHYQVMGGTPRRADRAEKAWDGAGRGAAGAAARRCTAGITRVKVVRQAPRS